MPYECGKDPVGSARDRYSIKFYSVAVIFLLFDIEVLFMVPFAVAFKYLMEQQAQPASRTEAFAFVEILVFIGTLIVGYIYVWKKGHFDWGLQARAEARAEAKEMARSRPRDQDRPSTGFGDLESKRRSSNFIMGLENTLFESLPEVLTVKLDAVVNWARKSSLWPATFGLACSAIEMMNTVSSRNDLSRFGAETFRASPRQADVMIVSGRVSRKMAPVLRRIYDQMPEPKWVISMGACATSGGVFDNYAIVQGVDKVVPVDVYVPGCPPRPEMLVHAIMMLQDKIMKESTRERRDTFEPESRISTFPARCQSPRERRWKRKPRSRWRRKQVTRPYTVPARHERRRTTKNGRSLKRISISDEPSLKRGLLHIRLWLIQQHSSNSSKN